MHAEFIPAERHKGGYAKETVPSAEDHGESGPNAQHRPMWVQNQRNSWHGVDFPYHSDLDIGEYYKRYAETLLGVDDSVGPRARRVDASAANSIPRWSFTWATTASRSASTG